MNNWEKNFPEGELAGFAGVNPPPGKELLSWLATGLVILASAACVLCFFILLAIIVLPVLLVWGGVLLWRRRGVLPALREFLRRHSTSAAGGSFAGKGRDDDVIDV